MPTAPLRAKQQAARAEIARQAPEPQNRMVHRERVHDRRATKQALRELAGARSGTWNPSE